jgi:hypothetical protein
MNTVINKKLQVFVSSTYLDLREERQAAVAAILKNGHIPAGMELFSAGDEEQFRVIKRWIDESDVFMLLLGKRYGSLKPGTTKSYTQLEYEYAVSTKKPLFAVVITDAFANFKVKAGAKVEDIYEQSNQEQLRTFETTVKGKMCSFADDIKDIKLAVGDSLRDLERRHQFAGWISGKDLPDSTKMLSDLAATARHNSELQKKISHLEEQLSKFRQEAVARKEYGGHTFLELTRVLDQQKVALTYKEGDVRQMTLLDALLRHYSILASGVTSAGSVWNESMYHRVAAPLRAYGLTEFDKVPTGMLWQRLMLSDIGSAFVREAMIRLSAPPDAKAAGVGVAEHSESTPAEGLPVAGVKPAEVTPETSPSATSTRRGGSRRKKADASK